MSGRWLKSFDNIYDKGDFYPALLVLKCFYPSYYLYLSVCLFVHSVVTRARKRAG